MTSQSCPAMSLARRLAPPRRGKDWTGDDRAAGPVPPLSPRLHARGPLGGGGRRQRQARHLRGRDDGPARSGRLRRGHPSGQSKHPEVMGLRCVSSITEIPEPVDLAILGVANARLEEQLGAAAEAGARSAVIFASCFEAPTTGKPPLTERLAAIARGAGMALCGGGGMGFVNFERS